jgi:hypothetical protein
MANAFAVCAQVAIMTAIFFDMHGGSTAKPFAVHLMQELLACMGGIHIHSHQFHDWGDKWVIMEGGLRGSSLGRNSGVLSLPVSLCTMLTKSNIKI